MKLPASTFYLPDPAKSRATRTIPKASQGHFVGEFVFGVEKPQRVGFESLLELKTALCTVYRPGFLDLEEQIEPIAFRRPNGDIDDHYLDYRAIFEGGIRIGIVVKPSHRAERTKFRSEARAVAQAALPRYIDKLAVVTEQHIHPVNLFNATLFHAARRPIEDEDRVIGQLVSRMQAPLTVDHLINHGRQDGVTLFGIARTIHRGGLTLLRSERIEGSTMVAANIANVAA